jgi:hypothetical protein
MCRQVVHVASKRGYEGQSLRSHTLNELLNDVVAVRVLDTLENVGIKLFDKGALLLR